jgi:hypothetical protein
MGLPVSENEPLNDSGGGRCPVCGTVMLAGWQPCRAQVPSPIVEAESDD